MSPMVLVVPILLYFINLLKWSSGFPKLFQIFLVNNVDKEPI